MQRRLFVSAAACAGLVSVLGLSACGFALRQAPNFAFSTLFTGLPESSPLGAELKRALQANGVRVITDGRELDQAQVILDVIADQREKTVVGVNAAGQVREFQLRLRFAFKLRTLQGKELIAPTELLLQREINFSESAVLAKEAEENLLYRDMQSDIVQQVVRRLAAVKAL
ncbi:MAG: LPS assembly lipoprotein LptE [Pseudomonadota bacterium]